MARPKIQPGQAAFPDDTNQKAPVTMCMTWVKHHSAFIIQSVCLAAYYTLVLC